MSIISRRSFGLGAAGLLAAAALPSAGRAAETRSVTTSLGTVEIPLAPQRVVAIDSRLDLQPALALGLPVVGYAHSKPGPWVPVPDGLAFYGSEVNIEQVLASEPDLIICSDYDPDSVWWPANRLKDIAPVVPTAGDKPWKEAFRELAALLGKPDAGDRAFAEYDALIGDIRTRRAAVIAERTLVSIQPGKGVLYMMTGSKMLQPQVLADLGVKTVPPADGQEYDSGEISPERFGDLLGGVDGIILATTGPGDMAGLEDEPLWQRLPVAQSGALLASNGNINYGSIYSAMHVARMVDELLGKLA